VKFPSVRWLVAIVATVFCTAAAGCDKQLQGKYTGSMDGERVSIEFHGNGKCTLALAPQMVRPIPGKGLIPKALRA
jgi:hypothetical protein